MYRNDRSQTYQNELAHFFNSDKQLDGAGCFRHWQLTGFMERVCFITKHPRYSLEP